MTTMTTKTLTLTQDLFRGGRSSPLSLGIGIHL